MALREQRVFVLSCSLVSVLTRQDGDRLGLDGGSAHAVADEGGGGGQAVHERGQSDLPDIFRCIRLPLQEQGEV